jgi:hypothetical protein
VLTLFPSVLLCNRCKCNTAPAAPGLTTENQHTMSTYKTTFHRDGTVTFWNVYEQQWNRTEASQISDQNLASMSEADRNRVIKMASK